MAENSRIGWTHHTQNFWWGCDKVSAECVNCYIGPIMKRGAREPFNGPLRTKDWSKPARWNRQAEEAGERRRVMSIGHPGDGVYEWCYVTTWGSKAGNWAHSNCGCGDHASSLRDGLIHANGVMCNECGQCLYDEETQCLCSRCKPL